MWEKQKKKKGGKSQKKRKPHMKTVVVKKPGVAAEAEGDEGAKNSPKVM